MDTLPSLSLTQEQGYSLANAFLMLFMSLL